MPSSGMLHHVALQRTDILEELSASSIRVTRVGKLGMLTVCTTVDDWLLSNLVCKVSIYQFWMH
jgi:hypothetical protein